MRGLQFRRTGSRDAPTASLSELVAAGVATLDPAALTPLTVADSPNHPGETPYKELACIETPSSEHGRTGVASLRAMRGAPDPAAAASLLRRSLEETLDRSLEGVRRVAVMTGGGLDSGALLALAVAWARQTGGSALGIAIDFDAPGDDRPHLRALERHLDCEIIRMAPEQAAASFALYDGVDAAPFTWPTAGMEVELMKRGVAAGAERVLTGAGGDQLFDGDPRSLARVARRGQLRRAVESARALRGFRRPRSPVASWVARPLVAAVVPRPLRRMLVRRGSLDAPTWAGPLLVDWLLRRRDHAFAESYASAARAQALIRAETGLHRQHLLMLRHQQEMASGAIRVDPYLDPLLLETVGAIPPEWLIHGDQRRGLFREALKGLLPESLRQRQDKSAFEPAIERFVAAAHGFEKLKDAAKGARLAAYGIVDARDFPAEAARFAASTTGREAWVSLWPALCVEAFLGSYARARA